MKRVPEVEGVASVLIATGVRSGSARRIAKDLFHLARNPDRGEKRTINSLAPTWKPSAHHIHRLTELARLEAKFVPADEDVGLDDTDVCSITRIELVGETVELDLRYDDIEAAGRCIRRLRGSLPSDLLG